MKKIGPLEEVLIRIEINKKIGVNIHNPNKENIISKSLINLKLPFYKNYKQLHKYILLDHH